MNYEYLLRPYAHATTLSSSIEMSKNWMLNPRGLVINYQLN